MLRLIQSEIKQRFNFLPALSTGFDASENWEVRRAFLQNLHSRVLSTQTRARARAHTHIHTQTHTHIWHFCSYKHTSFELKSSHLAVCF